MRFRISNEKTSKKHLIALILLIFSSTIVAREKIPSPQISELFIDLTSTKVLYAKHASLALIPASVTKLFVAARALQQWGAYYTFPTQIYRRGQWKNGILTGDLVFYGLGDPEFTNEKMWQLVNNLQQIGLKKIKGNIIVNASYFGNVMVSAPDRLEAKLHTKAAYDASLSSAGTNFGTIAVTIRPGEKSGDLAEVKISPYALQNSFLVGKVMTRSGEGNVLQLTRTSKDRKETFLVSGTIGVKSEPVTLYRSVGNPNVATGALLKAFLRQAGIVSDGKIIVELTPVKKTDTLLTQVESVPLIQSLQDMLRYSNNYIADTLTLDLWTAHQPRSLSSVKLSDAAKILLNASKERLTEKDRDSVPILNSGSGLTPSNRISANNLIHLLKGVYQNKRDFPVFYGSLVVPGQQTYWHNIPTIEHPWMSQTSVKTGHITVPSVVYTMAGYFRMNNGDLGAFAVLFNYPSNAETENAQLFKVLVKHLDSVFQNYL